MYHLLKLEAIRDTTSSQKSHRQHFPATDWSLLMLRCSTKQFLSVCLQDLLSCRSPSCVSHHEEIDRFCTQFLACLSNAATLCFPVKRKKQKTLPGWNDHVRHFRDSAILWNKIWVEAGCPGAGVLFDLRKETKTAYKYAVRRIKRRRNHIVALLSALFWKEVKLVSSSVPPLSLMD